MSLHSHCRTGMTAGLAGASNAERIVCARLAQQPAESIAAGEYWLKYSRDNAPNLGGYFAETNPPRLNITTNPQLAQRMKAETKYMPRINHCYYALKYQSAAQMKRAHPLGMSPDSG